MFRKASPLLILLLACCALVGTPPKPRKSSIAKNVTAMPIPDVPAAGASGELVDPVSKRSRAIAPMLETRTDFQATPMPDGRVLITGGSQQGATSEWFDPATRRFVPGPAMVQARQGHKAILLKDGSLLVLGGTERAGAPELLAPGANQFQALKGDMRFSLSTEAVELEEGRVLLLDGASGKASIWDQRRGFRGAGNMANRRILFRAVLLKDGRVMVTGGWSPDKSQGVRGLPVECYNPRWSTWSSWKSEAVPRARHLAAVLPDGKVCLWGGFGVDSSTTADAVEVLDPAKETVSQVGRLGGAGAFPGWVLANDGAGLFLPERSLELKRVGNPLGLVSEEIPATLGRLANGFLGPVLVPLKDGSILILGSPAWGASMERWDPRMHNAFLLGTLRFGVETLSLLKDGRVVTVGPVIDLIDPKSGNQRVLGWREDLKELLLTAKDLPKTSPTSEPPFPKTQKRKDYLLLPASKGQLLVIGGTPDGGDTPVNALEFWDPRKNKLLPAGTMKMRRCFPAAPAGGQTQGALQLPDSSFLIWGSGKD